MLSVRSIRPLTRYVRLLSASAGESSGSGGLGTSSADRDTMVHMLRSMADRRVEASTKGESTATLWSKLDLGSKSTGSNKQPTYSGKGKIYNNRFAQKDKGAADGKGDNSGRRGDQRQSSKTPAQQSRKGQKKRGFSGASEMDDGVIDNLFTDVKEGSEAEEGEEVEGKEGMSWEVDGYGSQGGDGSGTDEDGNRRRSNRPMKPTGADEQMLMNPMEWCEEDEQLFLERNPGVDVIDQFAIHAFSEAMKTEDHVYYHVEEDERKGRTREERMTAPRSLMQLRAFCDTPRLRNSPNEGAGAELAAKAWGVIHQNYYYTDAEKYRLLESVGTFHAQLEKYIAEKSAEATVVDEEGSMIGGIDMVQRPDFRPGYNYWMEEQRLLALQSSGPAVDNRFVQADTDWSVEAVVDEDQL